MPKDEKIKEALKTIAEYCKYRLENKNCDGCPVDKVDACATTSVPYHWRIEVINGK